MGTHVWCLIASSLLISVNAGLHDRVAQTFYETPQSSSPAPILTSSPSPPELTGMKEVVLFLTPEQVASLKEAGAIVKPFPKYESEYAELQERYQQNEQQYQTVSPTEGLRYDTKLQNYYKLLNIKEINDDLAQAQDTEEPFTEKSTTEKSVPTPRSKYIKSRQQYLKEKETLPPYVPKKGSRPKVIKQNTNSDYVRFLPNQENENLKIVPYQALPLHPYHLQAVQGELNDFPQRVAFAQALEEAQRNAYVQVNGEPQRNAYSESIKEAQQNTEIQANQDTLQKAYAKANEEARQIAFTKSNEKYRQNAYRPPVKAKLPVKEEPEKPIEEAVVEVPPSVLTPKPGTAEAYLEALNSPEFKESLALIEGLPSLRQQQEKSEAPTSPAPTIQTVNTHQDKLSLLLAPLYKHKVITESIARQQEELLSGELAIRSKLQQIKDSPYTHHHLEYATEVEKLTSNLGKQNALAEAEAISKNPSVLLNQDSQTPESRPIKFVHTPVFVPIPKPLEVKIPAKYPAHLDILRPVSYAVLSEKGKPKKPVVENENRGPETITANRNKEQLTIIRHIWEH